MIQTTRAAAILLALAATGFATTFSRATTADLVRKAQRVCCVRCESVTMRRDARTGFVFTYTTLRVLETMKGSASEKKIRLRIIGGRADGVETKVAGMPVFRRGGECVLLLGKKNRAGYPTVLQAARGALALRADKKGRRYVRGFVTGFADLRGPRITLDALRTAVKRAVAKAERAK
ncbi:MAG: hypothetical protein OER88_00285 [Planctomycetota bacterium]|nr:hypothetical protein [Planctomycetota bacterium]